MDQKQQARLDIHFGRVQEIESMNNRSKSAPRLNNLTVRNFIPLSLTQLSEAQDMRNEYQKKKVVKKASTMLTAHSKNMTMFDFLQDL